MAAISYSRFGRALVQIQERSRGSCCDELFARSDDQDSHAGTVSRNVAIRCEVLVPALVELDAEEAEASA